MAKKKNKKNAPKKPPTLKTKKGKNGVTERPMLKPATGWITTAEIAHSNGAGSSTSAAPVPPRGPLPARGAIWDPIFLGRAHCKANLPPRCALGPSGL